DRDVSLADRTSKRSALLKGGMLLFRDDPMGVGTGGFAAALRDKGPRLGVPMSNRLQSRPAHSGWVKLLVENGFLGAGLFMLYFASFGLLAIRRRDQDARRLGFLACVVLSLAFLATEYQSKGIW